MIDMHTIVMLAMAVLVACVSKCYTYSYSVSDADRVLSRVLSAYTAFLVGPDSGVLTTPV